MKKLLKMFLIVYGFVRVLRRIPEILDGIKTFFCHIIQFALGCDEREQKAAWRRYMHNKYWSNYSFYEKENQL